MRLTDNRGVNLVVDSVGGPTLQGSIGSLAYRGRVSMVGAAGREPQVVDVSSLMGGTGACPASSSAPRSPRPACTTTSSA